MSLGYDKSSLNSHVDNCEDILLTTGLTPDLPPSSLMPPADQNSMLATDRPTSGPTISRAPPATYYFPIDARSRSREGEYEADMYAQMDTVCNLPTTDWNIDHYESGEAASGSSSAIPFEYQTFSGGGRGAGRSPEGFRPGSSGGGDDYASSPHGQGDSTNYFTYPHGQSNAGNNTLWPDDADSPVTEMTGIAVLGRPATATTTTVDMSVVASLDYDVDYSEAAITVGGGGRRGGGRGVKRWSGISVGASTDPEEEVEEEEKGDYDGGGDIYKGSKMRSKQSKRLRTSVGEWDGSVVGQPAQQQQQQQQEGRPETSQLAAQKRDSINSKGSASSVRSGGRKATGSGDGGGGRGGRSGEIGAESAGNCGRGRGRGRGHGSGPGQLRSASRTTKNAHHRPDESVDERRARASHNLVERQYRNRLNAQFESLLNTIPASVRGGGRRCVDNNEMVSGGGGGDLQSIEGGYTAGPADAGEKRHSKAEVLEMARRHIKSLERERDALESERDMLLGNVGRLRQAMASGSAGRFGAIDDSQDIDKVTVSLSHLERIRDRASRGSG